MAMGSNSGKLRREGDRAQGTEEQHGVGAGGGKG